LANGSEIDIVTSKVDSNIGLTGTFLKQKYKNLYKSRCPTKIEPPKPQGISYLERGGGGGDK
jgi:hypothetical protein